jgi:RNA polymerase primary sigma factor
LAEHSKNDADSLRLYFDDIVDSTPLTREREVELSARIQRGDGAARDELVNANLRFVVDVAKRYQGRGLSFPELISAGNLGLLTAADRFDGTRGFKFISYAVWWIRQSILQTLAEQSRTVRLPTNRISLLNEIAKVSNRLGQGQESAPNIEAIAAELNISAAEVVDTIHKGRDACSLDEMFEEDDDRSLMDVLEDDSQAAPDTSVATVQVCTQIESTLGCLDDRERYIICSYYGLSGEEPMTLEQIGVSLDLTRERVRQVKERALSKLRDPARVEVMATLEIAG